MVFRYRFFGLDGDDDGDSPNACHKPFFYLDSIKRRDVRIGKTTSIGKVWGNGSECVTLAIDCDTRGIQYHCGEWRVVGISQSGDGVFGG